MKHLIGILVFCAVAYAHADLTNGLVAFFPFNGNADNGVVNGAILTTDRFGNPDSAYSFNGTNSYIVANITNLPAGDAPRTMTAWMLIPYSQPGQLSAVGYGANNGNSQFGLGGNGDVPYFWQGITDWQPALPPQPLGVWFFEAVTYSNGIVSVWLNGSNSLHNATLDTFNNGKFFIGAMSENGKDPSGPAGGWKLYFAGALDDIRLYDKALTDDEMRELYSLERPCSPHKATASATVVNGFLVGLDIKDSGCGYTNAPLVQVVGGGGTGATAVATIENGVVSGIKITDAGHGYTSAPSISIASPPFAPFLDIAVSKVTVTSHVVLGRSYVIESSADLTTWTPVGSKFTAQSESIDNEFDVAETGRYFRISEAP